MTPAVVAVPYAGAPVLPACPSILRHPGAELRDVSVSFAEFVDIYPGPVYELASWLEWKKVKRRDNAWKAVDGRDLSHLEDHLCRGIPSPPDWNEWNECIVRRNARELAEQLGYYDPQLQGPWPMSYGTMFLPKPGHDFHE